MTDKNEVMALAKKCGVDRYDGVRDDESHGYYYEAWEEQLLAFSAAIEEKSQTQIAMFPPPNNPPTRSSRR